MIARLKGIVDGIDTGSAIIDVNGVGYLIFASGRTLSRLVVGEATTIEVETHVREDHIHLYGFADIAERDWFLLLTTVQGVGAKVALAMLGILSPDELLQAIAANDKAAVTRAPGVGPKLATRILSELKDKVGNMALGAVAQQTSDETNVGNAAAPAALADAASALVNLGYGPSEALGAVSRVAAQLGEGASVEELIQGGLKELAGA
jgi:holliday junction DNA helicase RuvA